MKKVLIGFLSLLACAAFAQPDDKIVYYEDSRVPQRRFSLALEANPNYTDRRLINDELPQGGGIDLVDNEAAGGFGFNYNLDLFYSIGSSMDIGVGFGRGHASFRVENAEVYSIDPFLFPVSDTLLVNAETEVDMWTVPIKVNFNTSMSDIFDLEVIPTVQLIFIDRYETDFDVAGTDGFTYDFTDHTRNLNYTVGISLGGSWYFADNWGFFLRANARYMLNSMVEAQNYPRETLYSFGANTGIKVRF